MKRLLFFALALVVLAAAATEPRPGAQDFAREVDMRLEPPLEVQAEYARRLEAALVQERRGDPPAQYFVLVDRSAHVQAAFVYWRSPESAWRLIGASPVSTGLPREYEHFLTPLGVFPHNLANPDYRAEGTRNDLGILGYGREGTDPELLEPLLGERRSKGCIRIPASLNVFIDRYGLLDAQYEQRARDGEPPPVLRAEREPTPWPGRWLVVFDSQRAARPAWAQRRAPQP